MLVFVFFSIMFFSSTMLNNLYTIFILLIINIIIIVFSISCLSVIILHQIFLFVKNYEISLESRMRNFSIVESLDAQVKHVL